MTSSISADNRAVRSSHARQLLLGSLTVLVIVAAATTGYLALRPSPPNVVPTVADNGDYIVGSLASTDATDAVTSAARALPDLLSYDYRSLDATLDRARPHLTLQFADEFSKTFHSTVASIAGPNKTATKTLVRGAGLIEMSPSRARCLVFVDQLLLVATTAGGAPPTPQDPRATTKVAQNRVVVELTKQDGTWLVSGLAPI